MKFSFPNKGDIFKLTEDWSAPISWQKENLSLLGALGLATSTLTNSGRAQLDDEGKIVRTEDGKAVFKKIAKNGYNPLYQMDVGYMDADHTFVAGSRFAVTRIYVSGGSIKKLDLKILDTSVKKLKNKRLSLTFANFMQIHGSVE